VGRAYWPWASPCPCMAFGRATPQAYHRVAALPPGRATLLHLGGPRPWQPPHRWRGAGHTLPWVAAGEGPGPGRWRGAGHPLPWVAAGEGPRPRLRQGGWGRATLFLWVKRAGGPANTTWGCLTCLARLPQYPCQSFGRAVSKSLVGLPHRDSFFHTVGSICKKKVEDPFYFYKILLFLNFFFWGYIRHRIASFDRLDSTYSFL
jgi:hypothetical protein